MPRLSLRLTTLLALALLSACTATTIQSIWSDPTFTSGPFSRIAVVALFETVAENRTFEENAARELEQRGVAAIPSYRIVGDDRMREQDELRAELADAGVDGILIYRLIAVDERDVYRNPAQYLHVPPSIVWGDPYYWYYYPRWDYYWHWRSTWDVTRSPGYWEPIAYFIVESSLYDARTDRLVWTAKSATMDSEQFEALAESVATKVTDELAAMAVLRGGTDRAAATSGDRGR